MAFGDTESINLESPGRSLYKKRRDFSARAPGRKRTMFVSSLFFLLPRAACWLWRGGGAVRCCAVSPAAMADDRLHMPQVAAQSAGQ